MKSFYETEQRTNSGHWVSVGFFLSKKKAQEYLKTFNNGTEFSCVKITERKFLDGDYKKI